jgi:hypothetical protein
MSFDPYNCFMKIWESRVHRDSNSQSRSSLGSVQVHSLTLFCTPGSMKCDSRASLLARSLASPYLGREPKARVVTLTIETTNVISPIITPVSPPQKVYQSSTQFHLITKTNIRYNQLAIKP